jgi:hypothetical protein
MVLYRATIGAVFLTSEDCSLWSAVTICSRTPGRMPHFFTHSCPHSLPIGEDWTVVPSQKQLMHLLPPSITGCQTSPSHFQLVVDSCTTGLHIHMPFYPVPFTAPWWLRQQHPLKWQYPITTLQSVTTPKKLTWIFTTMQSTFFLTL